METAGRHVHHCVSPTVSLLKCCPSRWKQSQAQAEMHTVPAEILFTRVFTLMYLLNVVNVGSNGDRARLIVNKLVPSRNSPEPDGCRDTSSCVWCVHKVENCIPVGCKAGCFFMFMQSD